MSQGMERMLELLSFWPEWTLDPSCRQPIGKGANGAVFRVLDRQGHTAAVKWISIPADSDDSMLDGTTEAERRASYRVMKERVMTEARTMQSMGDCPYVVRMEEPLEMMKPGGSGYDILIRMEFLTPLSALFPRYVATEQQALHIAVNVCSALAYCARRNIIHRDIKPANLFVDARGTVKVGDFGTAREIGSFATTMIGTPLYMAPEMFSPQARYGADVDTYALGLVLYRYLNNGLVPFYDIARGSIPAERTQAAQMLRLQGMAIQPARCASPGMNRILLQATAFRPEQRYPSADAMLSDLLRLTPEMPQLSPEIREAIERLRSPAPHGPEPGAKQNAARPARTKPQPAPAPQASPKPRQEPAASRSAPVQPAPEPPVPRASAKAEDSHAFVTFGHYPCSGDAAAAPQPIRWRVLHERRNAVLLLADQGLDMQPYHQSGEPVTWEKSSLRQWLNADFFETAFSREEQRAVPPSLVRAQANPKHGTDPGPTTLDRVFLLSCDELARYLEDKAQRRLQATPYALLRNPGTISSGSFSWWLRTPGASASQACTVLANGSLFHATAVDSLHICVRPAIWVSWVSSAEKPETLRPADEG